MKELIRVTTHQIGKRTIQTCQARELHRFLGVGRDFSNWIKDRIKEYGYQEDKDFEVFAETGENHTSGRPSIEYALSLDMAKELAMVEKNDMGRMARRYFIACERVASEQMPILTAELLKHRPVWQKIKRYKEMGLQHVEIAKLLGIYPSGVRRHVRSMESCGLLTPPANLKKMQTNARQLFLSGRGVH